MTETHDDDLQVHFFTDDHGYPRARSSEPARNLGDFLVSDVQGSEQYCRDIVTFVNAIEEGRESFREFVGNSYALIISQNGVRIESLFDEEVGFLSRQQLRDAVLGWIDFVRKNG